MRRKRSNFLLVSVVVVILSVAVPWVSSSPSEFPASSTTAAADNVPAIGNAKLKEACTINTDCATNGAICENAVCKCHEDLPATDDDNRCGKERSVNQSCEFNQQCTLTKMTSCMDGLCKCVDDLIPYPDSNGVLQCQRRGNLMIGDACNTTLQCGYDGALCSGSNTKKSCHCAPDMPATNTLNKCGKVAMVNESCTFNEQCELGTEKTECRENRCQCLFEMVPVLDKDGPRCSTKAIEPPKVHSVDPAMIGVLVGMALMFVILCVVLRLFSKARWRENRTIFNTPNPRLMNVSLLRDSKLLHSAGERRGSRASVRAPSRQPSMASLRPQSPSQSIGSRRSRGSSSPSVTSTKSPKSPTKPAANNIANNTGAPVLENVTVEVQDPKV